MKPEELKEGEIYKFMYPDGDYNIFRATKNLENTITIKPWSETQFSNDYDYTINKDMYHTITKEEQIWLIYCESLGEYREKEEALDNYYTKQFIQEYLTE